MPLADVLAAVRWWAVLTILGLAAFPLLFVVLRPLADRGYAFARMAGLLLVSYLFWITGSLGFLGNDLGGMLVALAVVAGLSVWLYRTRRGDSHGLRAWLGENRRTVLVTELVFAVVFALWVWVRAQNPSITATEKPMEFAFLNAVGRSPSFPPLDPWLSGYAISYYYFGYVMTSLLSRLALVPEALGFNLAVAWLVAGTAVGAYGLTYNLIAARGVRRAAVALGLIAALAVPVAGNLQIGLEVLHGNGVGSAAFWQWLDVRDVNGPPNTDGTPRYLTSNWWWWRTSRVIHEYHLSGRAEEGLEPIVEVPSFSFVLGDLHPHVLALPFAFLSLGVALAWWLALSRAKGPPPLPPAGWLQSTRALLGEIGLPLWVFTAVVLGGLSFLNTWDVLIHLFVVLGAFFLATWYRRGTTAGLLGRTALVAVLLVVPAALLYLPFYLGFRSQAGAPFLLPMLMRPTRLAHYLVIFGVPLLAISVTLVVLAARQRFRHWRLGVGLALGLLVALFTLLVLLAWIVASTPLGTGTATSMAAELGLTLPPPPESALAPGWGLSAVVALLPALLLARVTYPALTLVLAGLLALTIMVLREGAATWRADEAQPEGVTASADKGWSPVARTLPFALLLILTGILLTLGPEFVYLRDNFGVRLNTTFKFYYQAWAMFGVAAVYGLHVLWSLRPTTASRATAALTTAGYLALLLVALLFPVYAVQSRAIEYRGPAVDAAGQPAPRQPATLNGLAYLQRFNPSEYDALLWLRENAGRDGGPPPVILEAVGGQYSSFGRVAATTGLPTVLGWPGHEWQWRGSDHPEPGRREPIVEQIYTTPDLGIVGFLLDQFDVAYIYVGDLEASTYGPAGLEKFRDQLDVAYANDRVTIYRWESPDT